MPVAVHRSIETGTATLTDVDVVDAGVHPSGQPAVLVLHYAQLTMLVRRMCVLCVAVCGCMIVGVAVVFCARGHLPGVLAYV